MHAPRPKYLVISARLAQIVVAGVFIVAAALKAFHPAGFADQIREYKILPMLADVAAWSFILTEVMLAAALLVNLWTRTVSWLAIALLALFIGVTAHGMLSGLTGSCGCFGNLVHRTPWQVILEDALMIAGLVYGLVVMRGTPARTTPPKLAFFTAMGFLALATTMFSGRLPVDSLATALAPGRSFDSWPVESLYKDLNKGTHVVFLFSVTAPTIETDVTMMNAIAQRSEVPSTVALIIDGAQRLTELTFQYGLAFPAGALEPRFAKSLYRTLPRTFILSGGKVVEVWNGIPAPDAVASVLTRAGLAGRQEAP